MEWRVGGGFVAEMRCEDVECPDGVERGAYGDERSGGHRGDRESRVAQV